MIGGHTGTRQIEICPGNILQWIPFHRDVFHDGLKSCTVFLEQQRRRHILRLIR